MTENAQTASAAAGTMTVELNASAGDGNRELATASASITGPADHVLILLDKYQSGQITESATPTSRRAQINPYHYERAALLIRALRGEDLPFDAQALTAAIAESMKNPFGRGAAGAAAEEAEGTGLEAIESLLKRGSEELGDISVAFSSPIVDGKRDFIARITRDDETIFEGSIADALGGIAGTAEGTAFEGGASSDATRAGEGALVADGEVVGGEVVAENGGVTRKRLITRFRATANGEDDGISNQGTVAQEQLQAGIFILSVLNANVAAILEATAAFQVDVGT
jgi:hypothetical protein